MHPRLATPTVPRMEVSTPTPPSLMARRNFPPPPASATTGALHLPPAFNTDLNTQYNYSPPTYSSAYPAPPLHRGALPFLPSSALQFNHTHGDMDEIITSGSNAVASYPGFGVQDETMDTACDNNNKLDATTT
ncbi:putative methionyl-tRNA synthetase [Hordeum vulgare]|nr:putative methionyl-tRNA synthetase [Hordeum vulgare]